MATQTYFFERRSDGQQPSYDPGCCPPSIEDELSLKKQLEDQGIDSCLIHLSKDQNRYNGGCAFVVVAGTTVAVEEAIATAATVNSHDVPIKKCWRLRTRRGGTPGEMQLCKLEFNAFEKCCQFAFDDKILDSDRAIMMFAMPMQKLVKVAQDLFKAKMVKDEVERAACVRAKEDTLLATVLRSLHCRKPDALKNLGFKARGASLGHHLLAFVHKLGRCNEKGQPRCPVAAAARQHESVLVIVQDFPGKYEFEIPGGKRDLGETMLECAIRETCEESGIIVSNPAVAAQHDGVNAGWFLFELSPVASDDHLSLQGLNIGAAAAAATPAETAEAPVKLWCQTCNHYFFEDAKSVRMYRDKGWELPIRCPAIRRAARERRRSHNTPLFRP